MGSIGNTPECEEEVGGVLRSHRHRGPPRGEVQGHVKTPRRQENGTLPRPNPTIVLDERETTQTPVVEQPAVAAVSPQEEKKEKEMGKDTLTNSGKPETEIAVTSVESRTAPVVVAQKPVKLALKPVFGTCFICGKDNRIIRDTQGRRTGYTMCAEDNARYNRYADRTADDILNKKEDIELLTRVRWTIIQVESRIAFLEEELKKVNAQRVSETTIYSLATEKARNDEKKNGRDFPPVIFGKLVDKYEPVVRNELYHRAVELNKERTGAKAFNAELEQSIQKTAAPATPAPAEAPAPAPPAEAPTEPAAEATVAASTLAT